MTALLLSSFCCGFLLPREHWPVGLLPNKLMEHLLLHEHELVELLPNQLMEHLLQHEH